MLLDTPFSIFGVL